MVRGLSLVVAGFSVLLVAAPCTRTGGQVPGVAAWWRQYLKDGRTMRIASGSRSRWP
jgi:hypothetical protein